MAIDHTTFSYWWALWCEKWNRKPSPAFLREFHQAVDWLHTDEFEAGARTLWHGSGFFPSPAELVEKARPASGDAALRLEASQAFDAIQRSGRHTAHGPTWHPDDIAANIGPVALHAFGVAGGQSRFRHLTEQDEHWARKTFCDAYVDLARERTTHDSVAALLGGQRPKLGPVVRSQRLEQIGKILPLLPGTHPNDGNGTDG